MKSDGLDGTGAFASTVHPIPEFTGAAMKSVPPTTMFGPKRSMAYIESKLTAAPFIFPNSIHGVLSINCNPSIYRFWQYAARSLSVASDSLPSRSANAPYSNTHAWSFQMFSSVESGGLNGAPDCNTTAS